MASKLFFRYMLKQHILQWAIGFQQIKRKMMHRPSFLHPHPQLLLRQRLALQHAALGKHALRESVLTNHAVHCAKRDKNVLRGSALRMARPVEIKMHRPMKRCHLILHRIAKSPYRSPYQRRQKRVCVIHGASWIVRGREMY